MCEINPAREAYFVLEVFTFDRNISEKDFVQEVALQLLIMEQNLNNSKFRFHIHNMPTKLIPKYKEIK